MRFSFQWLGNLFNWRGADYSAIAEASYIIKNEAAEDHKRVIFKMLVDIMPDSIINWADSGNRELVIARIHSRGAAWLDACHRLERPELVVALTNADLASMHRVISEITWALSGELTDLMGFEFTEAFMTIWRSNLFWNLGQPDYDILNEFVLQRQKQEAVK